jgi:hypothetical protein
MKVREDLTVLPRHSLLHFEDGNAVAFAVYSRFGS